MTPEQFVYWLQGFVELTEPNDLTQRERIIADHLREVFTKKTPTYTNYPPNVIITPAPQDGGSGTYFPTTSPIVTC